MHKFTSHERGYSSLSYFTTMPSFINLVFLRFKNNDRSIANHFKETVRELSNKIHSPAPKFFMRNLFRMEDGCKETDNQIAGSFEPTFAGMLPPFTTLNEIKKKKKWKILIRKGRERERSSWDLPEAWVTCQKMPRLLRLISTTKMDYLGGWHMLTSPHVLSPFPVLNILEYSTHLFLILP